MSWHYVICQDESHWSLHKRNQIQTALQCLKKSMYVCLYIKLGKARTLLESADELLSNMFDGWTGLDGVDTS